MDLFVLDNLNVTIGESSIIKPKTYEDLLQLLKSQEKNLPNFYEIFILDQNNKEIIINSNDKYKLI